MNFENILSKCRENAASTSELGTSFEILSQRFLKTTPVYSTDFETVWLWKQFPYNDQFGGTDIGIDIVAKTERGEYWAVQCKCYEETTTVSKEDVDTFLATSGRSFTDEHGNEQKFSARLWIQTTYSWTPQAEQTAKNQNPPLMILNKSDLENSPVDWQALYEGKTGNEARRGKKNLRKHQADALAAALEHYKTADRGKLIMACGTGKTYTSLKIAEAQTNNSGFILFLVPSIGLLNQTLNEWYAESEKELHAICVCSDPTANAKRKTDDKDDIAIDQLAKPASTDITELALQYEFFRRNKTEGMTVIFSTYQSIEVVSKLQQKLIAEYGDSAHFDLVICDEAHRTTGALEATKTEQTCFMKVHDKTFIRAKKRMYMTATPRVFTPELQKKAADNDFILCSMDDSDTYGEEFYSISFGEAVRENLLSDYKVLVLTLTEDEISKDWQDTFTVESEIKTDNLAKIAGSVSALSKCMAMCGKLGEEAQLVCATDPAPMHKAVAFAPTIKVSETEVQPIYNELPKHYGEIWHNGDDKKLIPVAARHVDGRMSASEREKNLNWLKNAGRDDENECRILTNVRCLSEGIDVPSLDAIIFLSPRNSQIEVIQSVGRVMRKAEGKKYGYIIIPVVIPSGVEPDEALDDNKTFKVVWEVLQALRAHDERIVARIEKMKLNKSKPSADDSIVVVKVDGDYLNGTDSAQNENGTADTKNCAAADKFGNKFADFADQTTINYEDRLVEGLYARIVKRVGRKKYWEMWADEIAAIAKSHIEKITEVLKKDKQARAEFAKFMQGLHANINPYITETEARQMLAQHFITRPVFEALFGNFNFAKNNSVSVAMQSIFDILDKKPLFGDRKEEAKLEKFYKDVKQNYEGIETAQARQQLIKDLYEKFFKKAMPQIVEKLGIVYTPVEIVDFIVNSVCDILKKEFNRDISDENVNILDPFTGTGTFITRLLQSGRIATADLPRKYKNELYANEIVLLAYYIASVNIETAYHDLTQGKEYAPFEGICLTDTFQLYEQKERISAFFPKNSARLEKQIQAPITVIIGNPPYSVGQKSANDNAQNQKYEKLEKAIANTYALRTSAVNKNKIYDSYIKAFRWATDRIAENGYGVIGFITNGIWLDNNSMDGFRKCLQSEFDAVYVLNLRGGIKGKIGDAAKREGQNVFDIMTGVAITFLVRKNNSSNKNAKIFYRDIGDYLSKSDKLLYLSKNRSILNKDVVLQKIKPNEQGDWISSRSTLYTEFVPSVPDKKKNEAACSLFSLYSLGLNTNRDAWIYNFSERKVISNMSYMTANYNAQVDLLKKKKLSKTLKDKEYIEYDKTKICWSSSLLSKAKRLIKIDKPQAARTVCYRAFCKQYLSDLPDMIHRVGQWYEIFPQADTKNLVISVPGIGERRGFACLMSDCIQDLNIYDGGLQAFPLYWYEQKEQSAQTSLFEEGEKTEYVRHDGITDFALKEARRRYGFRTTKEDIFYYVYGLLHSPDYRREFAANLKKELPRIPFVESDADFWAFSKAGRALADLHLNYETQPKLPDVVVTGEAKGNFRVQKLKYKTKGDKSAIVYNGNITVSNIPEIANEYVVNGRTPMEWIIDRYQVTTDKASGIKNDPNDWAHEHNKPRYILDLLLSVITVSVKTMEIINALPRLDFSDGTAKTKAADTDDVIIEI